MTILPTDLPNSEVILQISFLLAKERGRDKTAMLGTLLRTQALRYITKAQVLLCRLFVSVLLLKYSLNTQDPNFYS